MTSPLDQLRSQLHEAYTDLYASFIDPLERFCDDGERWLPLSGDGDGIASPGGAGTLFGGPLTELTLRDLRNQCRLLAATNEFAINGHENRISFIVGSGHSYRAVVGAASRAAPVAEVARLRANSPPSQGGAGGGF